MQLLLKSNTSTEARAKERFAALLEKYDLSPYYFTDTVQFEDRVIPHSHPVLTLDTFPYTDENLIVGNFIHEQLHWYFESITDKISAATAELAAKYPYAPWGHPLGCTDLASTYEHLLLCYLAHEITAAAVGADAARFVLYYLQNHHYVWVYQTIEADHDYLATIIEKYTLAPGR